jgi:membrane-associated phospholipid phosphatase
MHVAFSVMPAALSLELLESPWSRYLSVMLATLILVSTLTLKEHYFLDLVAGMALGLAAYGIYQWKARRLDSHGGFP